MRFFLTGLTAFVGIATSFVSANPDGNHFYERMKKYSPNVVMERNTGEGFENPRLAERASPYLNPKTKKFVVDGKNFPDVKFDLGESYAGLVPISDKPHETGELFFWFFPSANPDAEKEIAIWFNGGPGCSSLSGLLTENGPFLWQAGTLDPVQNPYSWTNLTNMVWVEQPIGVGYTQGTPTITDEIGLAKQFLGFYKNFAKLFNLEYYKVYLTGESYGGFYVPYIADAFLNQSDTCYYNLKGIAINDPIIGDETLQQQVVIKPYLDYWQNLINLNASFIERFAKRDQQCGYTQFYEKYFKFPAVGKLPGLKDPFYDPNYRCDQFDNAYSAILEINPCFNIYHISDQCPHPWSVLGGVNVGDYIPPDEVVYFNRSDVQEALHAKVGTDWQQCTSINVFGGPSNNQSIGDNSIGPALDGSLARVIEKTQNTIIGSGNLDMLLSTNGTLFAIQNMTWGGKLGLEAYPTTPFYVPYHPEYNGGALASAGYVGVWSEERGLLFYTVQLSGHELPGYAPGAAYRMLEKLLGRVKDLSEVSDFTTQHGNYTGTSPLYKREGEVLDFYQ